MLQGEHSVILLTFIKLPFAIKILFCLFLSGRLHRCYCILVIHEIVHTILDVPRKYVLALWNKTNSSNFSVTCQYKIDSFQADNDNSIFH